MMFNKILVLSSAPLPGMDKQTQTPLSNYANLAREVFQNLNPATDIHFSQGPMDVLDHSCSKLGFGGKMCIDGTFKFEEETDDTGMPSMVQPNLDQLKSSLTSINSVERYNIDLLQQGIPVIILAVKKENPGAIRRIHQQVCEMSELEPVKLILYVEHTVDPSDITTALWRFCNNLDPKRDNILYQSPSTLAPGKTWSCMGFDGTIKTRELDGFQRDWPNIIVASDATIKAVDEKCQALNIAPFLSSPSLRYKEIVYGEEAAVGN